MATLEDIKNTKQDEIKDQVVAIQNEIEQSEYTVEFYRSCIGILRKKCTHPRTEKRCTLGYLWNECTTCGEEL